MSEKVAYLTVTPSCAEHLNGEVEPRMHTAGLKGEVHTNENRQSRRSLRADDEDQVRWGPAHNTLAQVLLRGYSGDREELATLPHPQTDGIRDARRSRECRSLRQLHFHALLNLLGLRTGLHNAPRGDSHRVEVLPRRKRRHCAWPVRVQRCRRPG